METDTLLMFILQPNAIDVVTRRLKTNLKGYERI